MTAHAFDRHDDNEDAAREEAARAEAKREYRLLALFELNRELSVRIEERQVVDLVLFNLMGHLGTRQSALWLAGPAPARAFQMVRGHGVRPALGATLAVAFDAQAGNWWARSPDPVRIEDADRCLDAATLDAARAGGIALLGPMRAQGAIIGFVALGRRADGTDPSAFDLEMLRTSLSMAGVAIENSRLYHELQERNRRLTDAYRDLTELDQMKTEFVQNVNHELRTPLAVIAASAECLAEPPDADSRRQHLVTGILEQARKLGGMVQSLLDLTSIARHEADLRLDAVDVSGVIQEYASEHRDAVTAGGRHLVTPTSASGLVARIAPVRLRKVLDLLLDNATKFTPEGTTITLSLASDPEATDFVRVTLSDDGPGIPADHLSRIFRPFYQVDGSATRAAGGLGIGLAVARRLLATMGARIEPHRPEAGGTEFRILLPRE